MLCCYTPIVSNTACDGVTIIDVAILMVKSLTCSDIIDTQDTPLKSLRLTVSGLPIWTLLALIHLLTCESSSRR